MSFDSCVAPDVYVPSSKYTCVTAGMKDGIERSQCIWFNLISAKVCGAFIADNSCFALLKLSQTWSKIQSKVRAVDKKSE